MNRQLTEWSLFEIVSEDGAITQVRLRGRLRKFAIANGIEFLADNASDQENTVRFALMSKDTAFTAHLEMISNFIKEKFEGTSILPIPGYASVVNPVLSKIKVNDTDRYE